MAENDKITSAQFASQVKQKYPQYAHIPDDKLVTVVLARYPQYRDVLLDVGVMPPTGHIQQPPTGIAGVKAKAYDWRNRAGNWTKDNLDMMAATLGGLLGIEGGPPGAIGGAALGGAAGRSLQHLIGFAEGKPKATTSLDAAKDIGLAGAEQGLYELGGYGISRIGEAIKPVRRAAYIAYGARAGELGSRIDRVLPDLDKAAAGIGMANPKTVGQFGTVVQKALDNTETEFSLALWPIHNAPVRPTDVADAIKSKITPNMIKTPEGRVAERYLLRKAQQFEVQDWTIGELNQERKLITDRLDAWHKMADTGQAAKSHAQAAIAADTAAEEALKDLLYDAADRSGKRPSGYFRNLKQRQSNLIDLLSSVKNAKEQLTKASLERQGAPFSEKIHLRSYIHPERGIPGGVAGVSPNTFTDSLKHGNQAIAKAFPGTTQKAIRGARTVVGSALSSRDVDALPLRLLFANYDQPGAAAP